MKIKIHSCLDIVINETTIGFVTNYFNFKHQSPHIITTEIIIYPAITEITGIQLNFNWPTYLESSFTNDKQDIEQTIQLLDMIISNLCDYKFNIISRRETYNLEVNLNGKSKKAILIYEKYFHPNFKQLQILPGNQIMRFPINMEDSEIKNALISHFNQN
jgi:hypothetical protein